MSEIKALNNLREKIQLDVNNPWTDLKGGLLAMCDKVEREIAERYMELPVDTDGVPWHLGDITENGNRINGMVLDAHGWYFTNTLNDIDPSIHHHAKQRTIEDVLRDYGEEVARQGHQAGLTMDEIAAKYADELRQMGGESE